MRLDQQPSLPSNYASSSTSPPPLNDNRNIEDLLEEIVDGNLMFQKFMAESIKAQQENLRVR